MVFLIILKVNCRVGGIFDFYIDLVELLEFLEFGKVEKFVVGFFVVFICDMLRVFVIRE